ncbi:MAG: hypothetical protein NVSMB51_09390 [Solirubrobacteraceae bacterium]
MSSFEELDALSSQELHDRAVQLARERHDLRFFWELLQAIPEAKTIAAGVQEGEAEVEHVFLAWTKDFFRGGGRLDDGLRPLFIGYLQR